MVNPKTIDVETMGPCGPVAVRPAVPAPRLPAVAVIIPCRNYGKYLAECLESVLSQTLVPAEIIVVDDASTDDTAAICQLYKARGVQYLRVDHQHVWLARRSGLQATRSPFVVFLDADDKLDRRYLELAVEKFDSPEVGIVTTDLHCFGESNEVRRYPPHHYELQNWIHSAAMVRRAALDISGAFEGDPPCQSHADWYVWQQVQRFGFRVVRSFGVYWYRIHSDSMLLTSRHETYRIKANLDLQRVTLILPLSGRREWWPRLRDWVSRQTWPLSQLAVIVTDTGPDNWSAEIRQWLTSLPVAATTYLRFPNTKGLADQDRAADESARNQVALVVPQLFQRAVQHTATEYLVTVEDDILPPEDAIDRLMNSMDYNVAAVSGVYLGRYAWKYTCLPQRSEPGVGVEEVDATGFGCLLVRRSALQQTVLSHAGTRGWYDFDCGSRLKQLGWRWRMDWSVRCKHQHLDAV